jgi:uroporphyrinogen-III synthase
MAKIFITRHLEVNSPILDFALVNSHEVVGRSLLQISRVKVGEIPKTPWIFFYSKNGVKHFVGQLDSAQINHFRNCKLGAIGNKTAAMVEKCFDKSCDFVVNPDQTNVDDFIFMIGTDKCLFPRASNSKESIEKVLPEGQVEALVVYNNIIDDCAVIDREADLVIFTSPMNVDAYLLHSSINFNQKLISIGHTTHNYLESIGFKSQKAYDPSEEGITSLLKDILE